MIVAVYSPHLWSRPTGVAWWDELDGTVRGEFSDANDRMLALSRLIGASNRIEFEGAVAKLSQRTPQTAVWGSADISVSPEEYLAILQRAKQPA